jgi:hypothetical protein
LGRKGKRIGMVIITNFETRGYIVNEEGEFEERYRKSIKKTNEGG